MKCLSFFATTDHETRTQNISTAKGIEIGQFLKRPANKLADTTQEKWVHEVLDARRLTQEQALNVLLKGFDGSRTHTSQLIVASPGSEFSISFFAGLSSWAAAPINFSWSGKKLNDEVLGYEQSIHCEGYVSKLTLDREF